MKIVICAAHTSISFSVFFQEGLAAETLQWAHKSTISLDQCREAADEDFRTIIHDNTICTISDMDVGVCYGDAGGPLFVDNAVIGIISWRNPCGGDHPDVYARVSAHAEWIQSVIED